MTRGDKTKEEERYYTNQVSCVWCNVMDLTVLCLMHMGMMHFSDLKWQRVFCLFFHELIVQKNVNSDNNHENTSQP